MARSAFGLWVGIALSVDCMASQLLPAGMDWFHVRFAAGAAIALSMAARGFLRKSLSMSGALAAVVVGLTTVAVSWRFGITMIAFYLSSSILTRVGSKRKAALERGHADGGQRDAWQVLINAGVGTVLCLLHAVLFGWSNGDVGPLRVPFVRVEADGIQSIAFQATAGLLGMLVHAQWIDIAAPVSDSDVALAMRTGLLCGIVGSFACACGDTWASELGILAQSRPRLVTSCCLRAVPPGTNGGVSLLGTVASVAGGLFVGLVAALVGYAIGVEPGWTVLLVVGAVSGFCGSMIDSFLGATLQETVFVPGTAAEGKEGRLVALNPSEEEVAMARAAGRTMGVAVLSNNGVNLAAILATTALSTAMGVCWCLFSLPGFGEPPQ